jgi:hypothetical protein
MYPGGTAERPNAPAAGAGADGRAAVEAPGAAEIVVGNAPRGTLCARIDGTDASAAGRRWWFAAAPGRPAFHLADLPGGTWRLSVALFDLPCPRAAGREPAWQTERPADAEVAPRRTTRVEVLVVGAGGRIVVDVELEP